MLRMSGEFSCKSQSPDARILDWLGLERAVLEIWKKLDMPASLQTTKRSVFGYRQ